MRKSKGFTLIELVVVVMILGILAAVAAPKLLGTSSTATDNGVRQTLAVVRDAIERYASDHGGALPGADSTDATMASDLATYLRGKFPTCPVGIKDNRISFSTSATPMSADSTPAKGWKYSTVTGEFIINSHADTNSDSAVKYDAL